VAISFFLVYYIYMKIPQNILLDKEGQYCIQCFSGPIKRIFKENLTYYHCLACGITSERSLVIDNKIVWRIDEQRMYWHESVGVVLVNEDNKILCLMRQIYPFAYSIPAGHLDVEEKPEVAAKRELAEETGISKVEKFELVKEFDMVGDSCRRGSDDHHWHLYRAKVLGRAEISLADEASSANWFSIEEIKKLKNVAYPLKYIIETFGASLIA
jgi:8-oxo-dGTP pyrophosphatase MutT (NUDIX family)